MRLSHILLPIFSPTLLLILCLFGGVSRTHCQKKKREKPGLAASEHLLGLDGATPPGLLYLYISFGYDCRARSLLPRWAWVSHTLVGLLTPTQKKNTFLYFYPLPVPGYHSVGTARPQHGWGARCFGTRNGHVSLSEAVVQHERTGFAPIPFPLSASTPQVQKGCIVLFLVPAERASGFTCFRGHSGARLLVSFWVSHSDLTGSCAE